MERPSVVVVGAGVTGLTVAYGLVRGGQPVDVTVVEAASRPGGKLGSVELGGLRLEAGADSFVVRKPWAVDLCNDLGLQDRVIVPGTGGASVWTTRGLLPFPQRSAFGIPAGIGEVLRWGGLTLRGRLRAATEPFRVPRKETGDEPLGQLLRRRLGAEAARVMVEPLLGGLHAGDASRLSLDATFPELRVWEQGHDSLMRGARAALKAGGNRRQPLFATVWGGLEEMVRALVLAIGPDRIRLDTPVATLRALPGGGFVAAAPGGDLQADAVVLAVPAFEAARLLAEANPTARHELVAIPYASTAVVLMAYPEGTAALVPEGTGFVVPAGERSITACTWLSRKWPQDAFGDRAVVRCFVGRAGAEEALDLPDAEIIKRVAGDVSQAVPLPEPDEAVVVRWDRSMPQYEVGHLERLVRIDRAMGTTPGLVLTGSAYRGVGIADCIRQGREAAQQVLAHVHAETREAIG